MNHIKKHLYCLPALFVLLATVLPSDAASVRLNSAAEGGDSVFSAELLETGCAKTGVVLYHGRGLSLTGPVMEEIRISLNRVGYNTLSIDNPVPLNGQTDFTNYVNDIGADNYVFPEAYAHMCTAIKYLQSRGVERVVATGFSLGSRLASVHITRGLDIYRVPVDAGGITAQHWTPDVFNMLIA